MYVLNKFSANTVVLRNLQKVLDTGRISAKGLRCHRNSLATIGYSRDICPKSPKNVSYCIRYLEKTLKICEFFDEICISDFAKMGWKRGQLCLGCLEGFCFCFDVWIQCGDNNYSSFILQTSHQEQMSEHFLNLWRRLINLKVAKSETLCIFRSTTVNVPIYRKGCQE